MPKLYTLFEDNAGGLSMMRACLFAVIFVTLFNWSYICYIKKELIAIPDSSITLIAAVAGAKALQRFGEKNTETTPTS